MILGATGSGKTEFAIYLLGFLVGRTQIDILDTKIEPAFERLPGCEVVESFSLLDKCTAPVRIYRPVAGEQLDYELLDAYCQWRYENAPNLTYIDELNSLGATTKPRPGLLNLQTRGRSRQASLWMSSQRPAWVTRFSFSETQRFFVFYLNDEDDRARVVKFTRKELIEPPREEFGFWYYKVGTRQPEQFKPIKLRR